MSIRHPQRTPLWLRLWRWIEYLFYPPRLSQEALEQLVNRTYGFDPAAELTEREKYALGFYPSENNMPPTSSTYRKIETEMVKYSSEEDKIRVCFENRSALPFGTGDVHINFENLHLTIPQAHQLHRELGEVLEEIKKV